MLVPPGRLEKPEAQKSPKKDLKAPKHGKAPKKARRRGNGPTQCWKAKQQRWAPWAHDVPEKGAGPEGRGQPKIGPAWPRLRQRREK